MDPLREVKEECLYGLVGSGTGSSLSSYGSAEASKVPKPMEGLHDANPPAFVTMTFDVVDDPSNARAVSWSRGGHSFVVWDTHAFSTTLLPKYFKHSNFYSFVRQLNIYGFRKIDPDRWEFANECFLMGHKHLLKYIRRRRVSGQNMASLQQAVVPSVEFGGYGADAEVEKEILMLELVELRKDQQNTKMYLQAMEQRIQVTEQKQQRMMAFIARAMQNPDFIHTLIQHKSKRDELEEAASRKRRWSIDQGCSQDVQGWNQSLIKAEPEDAFEVSELEALALEMQGYRGTGNARQVEVKFRKSMEKELDEQFWEELLTTRLDFQHNEQIRQDEDLGGNPWARTCRNLNTSNKSA